MTRTGDRAGMTVFQQGINNNDDNQKEKLVVGSCWRLRNPFLLLPLSSSLSEPLSPIVSVGIEVRRNLWEGYPSESYHDLFPMRVHHVDVQGLLIAAR